MLSNQTFSSFFVFYGTATLFLEIIYSLTSAKREAILFLFGCSEVNSTWLITSELANQRARKTLFTCVVYTNIYYLQYLLITKMKCCKIMLYFSLLVPIFGNLKSVRLIEDDHLIEGHLIEV